MMLVFLWFRLGNILPWTVCGVKSYLCRTGAIIEHQNHHLGITARYHVSPGFSSTGDELRFTVETVLACWKKLPLPPSSMLGSKFVYDWLNGGAGKFSKTIRWAGAELALSRKCIKFKTLSVRERSHRIFRLPNEKKHPQTQAADF